MGSLLALLWRGGFLTLGTTIVRRPLMSLVGGLLIIGGGVGYAVVLVILLIILSFILEFIGLGGLIAFGWVGGLLSVGVVVVSIVLGGTFIAGALASLVLGRLVMKGRVRVQRYEISAWLALGAVAYTIAGGVPYIGPLVQVAAALAGLEWRALARLVGSTLASGEPAPTVLFVQMTGALPPGTRRAVMGCFERQ